MARSAMTLAVVVAACLLSSAFAHTCLLHPLQRGGAPGATKMPADKVCGKTTGPCGGAPMGKPSMMVKAGSTVEINWVKNLNHYNPTAPGNFSLFGINQGMRSPLLYSVPDTNTPSLTPYHTNITVPGFAMPGTYQLQLVYYTGRGFNFFQCADVQVTSAAWETVKEEGNTDSAPMMMFDHNNM